MLYPLSYRGVARILPNPAWITEQRQPTRLPPGPYMMRVAEEHMLKLILGGLAALLLVASVVLWMLRPGAQRLAKAAPRRILP